jgi:hypothetical protein
MRILSFVDIYVVRARLFPAILAAAPAFALAVVCVAWDRLALSQVIATLALGVLLFVLADLARRRGKRIEAIVEKRLGGRPSALRYRDTTLSDVAKARYLVFLGSKLGEIAPSPADEARDPVAADQFYDRASAWLREHTRDTKKFSILFEENITYGFRRNLYGLKWPALILNVVVIAISAMVLWFRHFQNWEAPFSEKFSAVIIIAVLHALYIAIVVTEKGVIEASRQYARQLALCCETLMGAEPVRAPTRRRKPPSAE